MNASPRKEVSLSISSFIKGGVDEYSVLASDEPALEQAAYLAYRAAVYSYECNMAEFAERQEVIGRLQMDLESQRFVWEMIHPALPPGSSEVTMVKISLLEYIALAILKESGLENFQEQFTRILFLVKTEAAEQQ